MAILFHCPHCSSAIRVPDAAAGKQGTCPNCKKKLVVPQVSREAVAEAPPERAEQPQSPMSTETSPEPVVDFAQPGRPQESPFPGSPADIPIAPAPLRRRRRKSTFNASLWLVPVALGSALVACVAYLMKPPELRLEGQLAAQALPTDAAVPSLPVAIDPNIVDDEVRDAVLKRFEDSPLTLVSSSLRMEFRAVRERLTVSVESTAKSDFVVVAPPSDPAMQKFLNANAAPMNDAREQELQPALKTFFEEYSGDSAPDDVTPFRDKLGLAALTQGLGYCTEAVVGTTGYRCVYEDSEGRLYFLLPTGTQQFGWRGRKLANGRVLFPGRYEVTVNPPPTETPKKKPGAAAQPEMEKPEGDSP